MARSIGVAAGKGKYASEIIAKRGPANERLGGSHTVQKVRQEPKYILKNKI